MGSGLILLVIVAAWLAVLVPMALRSHESSTSLSSVDRFSDAMRVLSRRDAAARARARREAEDDPLSAQAWAANDADDAWDEQWDDAWEDEVPAPSWSERLAGWRDALTGRVPVPGAAPRAARTPTTPVVRRRRLLLGLVWATLVTTFLGVVGPRVLLAVAGGLGVVLVLFLVQLRRLAVARAARAHRAAPAHRPAARPAPASRPVARPAAEAPVRTGSVRVEPVDVPAEPLAPAAEVQLFDQAAFEPVASPAVRHDEPVPAASEPVEEPAPVWVPAPAAALGEAWSPVPVPPPTYVTAAVAPPPARRVVDLTRPGAWSQQDAARPAEELPGTAPVTPPAADRRRAVNEW